MEKTVDEEILVPLDYLKTEKPCRRGRSRKSHFINDLMDESTDIFMSHSERADYEFALKLQYEGVITNPGDLFKQSDQIEIEFLLANGMLLPLQYNSNKHIRVHLFKSRLVHKIKGKTTNKSYKKFRLVVQGYNDTEKTTLLNQAPTIQQYSQCLLLSVAPALRKREMKILLRDIT